jgi:hypothetical protein
MEPKSPNQGPRNPRKGNQEDFGRKPGDSERMGPNNPDRDKADERSRRKPDNVSAIPELPEPDVEGVGNEGRGNKIQRDERTAEKDGGM